MNKYRYLNKTLSLELTDLWPYCPFPSKIMSFYNTIIESELDFFNPMNNFFKLCEFNKNNCYVLKLVLMF